MIIKAKSKIEKHTKKENKNGNTWNTSKQHENKSSKKAIENKTKDHRTKVKQKMCPRKKGQQFQTSKVPKDRGHEIKKTSFALPTILDKKSGGP